MPARRCRPAGLRHALTTDPVDDPTLHTEVADRVAAWADAARPADPIQAWLVARAAQASVRLDRAAEREQAAAAAAVRSASADWQRRQRTRVRKAAQKLAEDPAGTLALLRASAFGCDWLIAKWDALAADLRGTGWLEPEEFALVLRMLGLDPARVDGTHPLVGQLWRAAVAIAPVLDPEEADTCLGCDTGALSGEARRAALRARLPEPGAARARLLAVAEAELAGLRALRARLWEEVERPQRAEAIRYARCPAEGEQAELRRYEVSHSAELHRCLVQLAQERARASRAEERAQEVERRAQELAREGVYVGQEGRWLRVPAGWEGRDVAAMLQAAQAAWDAADPACRAEEQAERDAGAPAEADRPAAPVPGAPAGPGGVAPAAPEAVAATPIPAGRSGAPVKMEGGAPGRTGAAPGASAGRPIGDPIGPEAPSPEAGRRGPGPLGVPAGLAGGAIPAPA